MKKVFLLLLLVFTFCLVSSCDSKKDTHYFVTIPFVDYFDTTGYIITEYDLNETSPMDVQEDIYPDLNDLLDTLEHTFAGSDSLNINSLVQQVNSKMDKVTVNDHFMNVLLSAKNITNSYNKFNVTCGALSKLWDISNKAKLQMNDISGSITYELPDQTLIDNALATIGLDNIEIDETNKTVKRLNDKTLLDFGAIAKGYAVDKIKELMINKGYPFFVINFGGNVYEYGTSIKYTKSNTLLAIEIAGQDDDSIMQVYEYNTAIVTSGVYNRYIKINNKKYSHILDLSTGYPVDNNIVSVTIINPNSMLSDSIATLCITSGLEEAQNILNELNLKGIIVTDDKKIYICGNVQYQLLDLSYEIKR